MPADREDREGGRERGVTEGEGRRRRHQRRRRRRRGRRREREEKGETETERRRQCERGGGFKMVPRRSGKHV